jgi:hypothetical protein
MSHKQNSITFAKDDRLFSYGHHPKPIFPPVKGEVFRHIEGWHCWQSPEWIERHKKEVSPASASKNKKFYDRTANQ